MEPEETSSQTRRKSLGLHEINPGPDFLKGLINIVLGDLGKYSLRNPKKLRQGVRICQYQLHKSKKAGNAKRYSHWACSYRWYSSFLAIADIPETHRRAISSGWYVPIELSLELTERGDLSLPGNEAKLDLYLNDYFKSQIVILSNRVCAIFRDRNDIISEGVRAHMAGLYFVSVPVFLIQADGICEGTLYGIRNAKSRLKEFFRKSLSEDDDIIDILTQVITEETQIDTTIQRASTNALNRHAILHGQSVNYGTEKNSLKAFSLLAFISSLMNINK